MEKKNFKHLSLTKKFMISVYTMNKKQAIVYISMVTLVFILGIGLVMVGVFYNNNMQKAFVNAYAIAGITLMCISLLTITLSTIASNFGGQIFRKELEAQNNSQKDTESTEKEVDK